MALLGSLALEALRRLRRPSTDDASAVVPADLPLGLRTPANTAEESALESKAMVILQAMINAAKADGQIDARVDAEIERRDDRVAFDVRAELGECPLWSAGEQALYFVDIKGRRQALLDAGAKLTAGTLGTREPRKGMMRL